MTVDGSRLDIAHATPLLDIEALQMYSISNMFNFHLQGREYPFSVPRNKSHRFRNFYLYAGYHHKNYHFPAHHALQIAH